MTLRQKVLILGSHYSSQFVVDPAWNEADPPENDGPPDEDDAGDGDGALDEKLPVIDSDYDD